MFASVLNDDGRRLKSEFTTYLDERELEFNQQLESMKNRNSNRYIVNIDDYRNYNNDRALDFILYPAKHLPAWQESIKDKIQTSNSHIKEHLQKNINFKKNLEYNVGIEGTFGLDYHISPRQLLSEYLGKMVRVEGIITKSSLVRPKIVKSVHYCEQTKLQSNNEYRDVTALTGIPTSAVYPTKDSDGNLLTTEYGLCVYKDYQTLVMQEMPERAPPGQLPRSVDIIVEDDLVDLCKPGDRVQIIGIYKAATGSKIQGATNGIAKTLIVAVGVRLLSKDLLTPTIASHDIKNIKKLNKDFSPANLFNILGSSIAPSIWGHDELKKSLLLLLIGGSEKNLDNGTHIRGDINILLVGDPSTAKSQLLRFALSIAPLGINTTGRGSSGVGLTAAVTTDSDSGERRLEAGAMVLGDRGIVCIDEFDKMNDIDRVAIHEVMEQQTVTISKAGIHTSLNARCSVIAAANPIYGQYDRSRSAPENIGLPDSLLSRFDLLFIILDKINKDYDRSISEHVLRLHQYLPPGQQGLPINFDKYYDEIDGDEEGVDGEKDTPIWQKRDRVLHGTLSASSSTKQLLTIQFLKKYIQYAKKVSPELSVAAADLISEKYAEFRNHAYKSVLKNNQKMLPVTARSLETLIRLSTAHAKMRLSRVIDEVDAKVAVELLHKALFGDSGTNALDDVDTESDDDNNDNNDNNQGTSTRKRKQSSQNNSSLKKSQKRQEKSPNRESQEGDQANDEEENEKFDATPTLPRRPPRVSRNSQSQSTSRSSTNIARKLKMDDDDEADDDVVDDDVEDMPRKSVTRGDILGDSIATRQRMYVKAAIRRLLNTSRVDDAATTSFSLAAIMAMVQDGQDTSIDLSEAVVVDTIKKMADDENFYYEDDTNTLNIY